MAHCILIYIYSFFSFIYILFILNLQIKAHPLWKISILLQAYFSITYTQHICKVIFGPLHLIKQYAYVAASCNQQYA